MIWLGMFALGIGFGVLVVSYGFPWWFAPLLSGLMFAGSVEFIRAESSYPTTETSPGTSSPARRIARIAPSANGSDAHRIAVTPAPRSRFVAA